MAAPVKTPVLRKPARYRFRKGSLVQMINEPWKYGPGRVLKFPHPGLALVNWPRRAKPYHCTPQYLRPATKEELQAASGV